jgi:hypothetical protein
VAFHRVCPLNPAPAAAVKENGDKIVSTNRLIAVLGLACCLSLAPWLPVAGAGEPVVGSLVVNGTTVELPFAYAYAQKTGFYDEADPTWTLLFVSHPIDERSLDDHIWDAAYVRVGITLSSEFSDEPELQVLSQDIRFSADAQGNVTGGTYPQIELVSVGPEIFAGRVYHTEPAEFFDDTFQYDFSFSVPLSDPFGPIGEALPAGGGEPGAAYLAFVDAIHAGDLDRLKTLVSPDQAAMLEGDDAQDNLGFIQMMTPTAFEITGGSSDGETAILRITGTMDGEIVAGEITLVHQDGLWIATGSAWD